MSLLNLVLPYSTVYGQLPPYFRDNFDTIEQKWFDKYFNVSKDTIFHSGLSLLDDNFMDILYEQKAFELINNYRIRRFSCDIGPCFRRYELRDNKYYGIALKMDPKTIHEEATEKIKNLRGNLPGYCDVAIETLNYYRTGAYEFVCEPELYNEICWETGAGLVFDIAHVQVSAHNMGIDFDGFASRFDRDNIREIHLSKIRVGDGGEAFDAHEAPDHFEFELLPGLTALARSYDLVIEYYSDADTLMDAYRQLQRYIDEVY